MYETLHLCEEISKLKYSLVCYALLTSFWTFNGCRRGFHPRCQRSMRDYDRNKQKPLISISKLLFLFVTWQVQIQYNLIRGIPMLCCLPMQIVDRSSSPIVECKESIVECKESKSFCVRQTQALPMVHCGLYALEVTNLNVVANNMFWRLISSKFNYLFNWTLSSCVPDPLHY